MSNQTPKCTKENLEILKLQKEIEFVENQNYELKKKWYSKPQWISALIPLAVGILTLFVLWNSQILQTQKMLNDYQQSVFLSKKDSINLVIKKRTDLANRLTDSLETLVSSISMLQKQYDDVETLKKVLDNKLLSDHNKYNSLLKKYLALQKSQASSFHGSFNSDKMPSQEFVDAVFKLFYATKLRDSLTSSGTSVSGTKE